MRLRRSRPRPPQAPAEPPRPRPPRHAWTQAGGGERFRVTRPPRRALQPPPQFQGATWTRPAPARSAADRPSARPHPGPGKVTRSHPAPGPRRSSPPATSAARLGAHSAPAGAVRWRGAETARAVPARALPLPCSLSESPASRVSPCPPSSSVSFFLFSGALPPEGLSAKPGNSPARKAGVRQRRDPRPAAPGGALAAPQPL